MLYVLYVLYLTRQPTEHPLPPGSMLYVLYVLYLTRQPTEHPLSPGSLLYVLYVLYGPYIAHIVQISSKELGESGCSVGCLVRYSTYSTYSKEPGESGCSVGCLVRYSTYSTYSMDPGGSGGSAGWRPYSTYSTYSTYSMELGEWSQTQKHLCGFALKKCDSSSAYINIDTRRIARVARFCATKCY